MTSKQERRHDPIHDRRGRHRERVEAAFDDTIQKCRGSSRHSSRRRSSSSVSKEREKTNRSSYSRRRNHRRDRSTSVSGDDRRKRRRATIRRRFRSSSRFRSRTRSGQRRVSRRNDDHVRAQGGPNQQEMVQIHAYNRRRPVDYRKSPSVDRAFHRRPRRKRRHRRHHRRSRSLSPSSSSSSASFRMLRPQALPRAGVVSDDEEGMGPSHAYAYADRRIPSYQLGASRRTDARRLKSKRDSAQSTSQAHDDTVGHFWGGPGTIVADSYKIVRDLGVGTFGRVVECLDLMKNRSAKRNPDNNLVAIKMVRKVKRYYESALIEADIVSDVNRRGGPRGRGISHFAVMYDAFNFRGHYCMVFESLGPSLYEYLKRNKYQPFPMHCIRDFSRQLLEAIEFIHSFRLIHTDLKPENILVTKCRDVPYGYLTIPESTRIKVIDFGGATYDDEKKSNVINTRQYRAPEVILGTGWSMPSDLWSAGCIMSELYQGELLFATHDNLEHLALMEKIIGPFPQGMLERANQQNPFLANQAFDSKGRHRLDSVLAPENSSYVLSMPSLESTVSKNDGWFLDLLRKILIVDPDARSSARDCLRTSFL